MRTKQRIERLGRTWMASVIALMLSFAICAACCLALCGCSSDSANSNALSQSSSTTYSSESSSRGNSDDSDSASSADSSSDKSKSKKNPARSITENGTYTSKNDVALYIHTFGHLPNNYISKTKARKAGWDAEKGNLNKVCPGKSIGGGPFYNDDGLLPDKQGRSWTECDINYRGGTRGAERIVFSNDGLVYYTSDHYKSFERLY